MEKKPTKSIPVGEVFQDRYRVLMKISEGGFGEVFQAEQLTTGQLVALKVLRQQFFDHDETYLTRFRREARLCARLHHPNIVRLLDSGETRAGLLYTVFEYVPGQNLAEVLAEEGCLLPKEAGSLMGQVLDALSCAHRAGIVHRDLKPGNIMIVPTGARRNVMVLDFGVSAVMQQAQDVDYDRLTATFERLGTPAYTAPEQLRGATPIAASDLYSWGLVFIECLTGRRAIPGASAGEVIHEQLRPTPVFMPHAIEAHPVGRLLRKVVDKDPDRRQVATEELLAQLESCDLSDLELSETAHFSMYEPLPTSKTRIMEARDGGDLEPDIATDDGDTASPSSPAISERRQITAVCFAADVVTTAPAALDVEEHDALLHRHQQLCTEIAGRWGGHVASVLGHQMLVCFGYPAARADDARRAALFGLDVLRETAARNGALLDTRAVTIDVRVGIHTGLVVVQKLQEATDSSLRNVLGGTPGIATRLSTLASSGAVIVSEATHCLLRNEFAFDSVTESQSSGSALLMNVYRLQGRLDSTPMSGPISGSARPLIGRNAELALLGQRWSQAQTGRGQMIVITGEAGIGKSRLVHELGVLVHEQPTTWLEGRCAPENTKSALRPLAELFAQYLKLQPEQSACAKRDQISAQLARYDLPEAEYLPLLATAFDIPLDDHLAVPAVPPQQLKAMMLDSVIALLGAMVDRTPAVLVIEDLHWADPTTIEFLSALLDEIHALRVCVVVTARPQFSAPWRIADVTQIQLSRLGHDGIRALISRITRGKSMPTEVVDEVARRTDGVPLFVEELTRTILESDALEEETRRYRLSRSLADLAIPSTLRDALMARLDRLGSAKKTAQIAAVIGREFDVALLETITSLDSASLQEDLDQLIGAELIHRRRRMGESNHSFKHALIRDIAYESLLRSTRRQYHAQIAQAIAERSPQLGQTRPDILAHHYAGAQEIPNALHYTELAAQAALARYANNEAASYTRQALSWLETLNDDRERTEIELRFNHILFTALSLVHGYWVPEVMEIATRSRALLDNAGANPQFLPILLALCNAYTMRSDFSNALECAQQALQLSEQVANQGQRISILVTISSIHFFKGEFTEVKRYEENAIELYDVHADEIGVSPLGYDIKVQCQVLLSLALWKLGYPEQALARCEAALADARKRQSVNDIVVTLIHLAAIRYYQEQRAAVRTLADEIDAYCEHHENAIWSAHTRLLRSWTDCDIAAGEAALAAMYSAGPASGFPHWSAMIASSEAAMDKIDAALERLEVSLSATERDCESLADIYRLKGDCLLQRGASGDEKAAESCFHAAIAVAQSQSAKMSELRATMSMCRLLESWGQRIEAHRQLQAIYNWFTEGFEVPIMVAAKSLLDRLHRYSVT